MVPGAGFEPARDRGPKGFYASPGGFPPARTISSPRGAKAALLGAGRSSAGIIVGAHPASLCTFRRTLALCGLAQDHHAPRGARGAGFPEFTRFLTRASPRGRPNPESPVSSNSTIRAPIGDYSGSESIRLGGGGDRIRTGDQGFAGPRLTTWLRRHRPAYRREPGASQPTSRPGTGISHAPMRSRGG